VSLDEVDEESGVGIQIADRSANPEEALLAREEDERLSQALAVLTPKERLLVQLRYEEGRALKEVAEMLRLNEGEVKAILKGVLKRLRQRLQ
jgi:RNA polymerase sigma factor (sigma-70 family)